MSGAIYHQARQLQEQGFDFDVIDGHYFYPDGVAIEQAATRLGKPFTVTARGTDINLIPKYPAPKKAIQTVLQKSGHNMAVCEALRQTMIALGAAPNSVTTLRNGVDLTLFPFADTAKQADLRQQLKLPSHQPVVLSVGHLIERKGHHLVIDAMKNVPDAVLVIAGSGPEEKALRKQVHNNGLASRISFVGSVSQKELAQYYGAANALVLASSREGWANVLLESMACGTPVVASNIWGTPEVVRTADAGLLVERTPEAIAAGMNALLTSPPLRSDTRRYAEQFDWLSTSQGQHAIFSSLISKTAHGR